MKAAGLVDVAAASELAPGSAMRVDVEDTPICLISLEDGGIHAIHDTCTHALASLSEGWVDGTRIECPRHGASFSALTGEALTPPATLTLPTFAVQVRDGRVLIDPTPSRPHPLHD